MTLRAYGRNGGYVLHGYHVQKNADTLYVGFSGKKGKVNAEVYGPQEEVIDMLEVLLQQAMDSFTEPYGGTWGEHPDLPRGDWGNEGVCNDTSLGYWAWVRNQIRIVEEDGEMGPEAAAQFMAQEIAGTEVDLVTKLSLDRDSLVAHYTWVNSQPKSKERDAVLRFMEGLRDHFDPMGGAA